MKKRLLIACIGLVLALTACGSKDAETVKDPSKGQQVETSQANDGKAKTEESDGMAATSPEAEILSENFNLVTGDHILFQDDEIIIRMVDGIQYNTYEDGKHDYTMQVKYIPKEAQHINDVRTALIYGFEFNGYFVRAFTNTEGFNYDLNNITEENSVCTVSLNSSDMFALQKYVADSEIKSVKAVVSRSEGGKKLPKTGWFTTGEEVRTEGCPEKFDLKKDMELVFSDELEDIYYGGYHYIDDKKVAYFILMRDIHDFSEEYAMEPHLSGYLKVNGEFITNYGFSVDETVIYPYSANSKAFVFVSFNSKYLKNFTKDDEFVLYLNGKESLIHDPTKPISYGGYDIDADIDVSDELRMLYK